MFNWLRRRFEDRRKAVFSYWDGKRVRRIDPMVVIRRLRAHPEFDWSRTPKQIDSRDEVTRLEGFDLTADAVSQAFEVQRFDGTSGQTETELVSLLIEFNAWLTDCKKKASSSPIFAQPTEAESSVDDSPTKSRSDSG